MKTAIVTILGVVMVSLVTGCTVEVDMNEKEETDMGSHHVVVKPGCTFTSSSSSSGGDSEVYNFSCGETSVTIHNEELIVNNAKYGKLQTGEPVLIDHGMVFVSNQKRRGTPLSDNEAVSFAPVKESSNNLAGYDVTVRPGSSMTSTTEIFGKHTFNVGNITVSIKNNELFVKDTPYGKLKANDTILIENTKVYVSGKIREARP